MTTAGEISGTGKRFYQEPQRDPRDPYDFYVEEPWCSGALFELEPFIGSILDPACGSGNILRSAKAHGLEAIGTDLVDRGPHCSSIGNFFDPTFRARLLDLCGGQVDNIVCNPPYGRGVTAAAFVTEAINLAYGKVAMLVQNKFPFSQRRHGFFTTPPTAPARLYYLSERPSMPPGELLQLGLIEPTGGKVDYLWIVWERSHRGPTTAHWLPPRSFREHRVGGKVRIMVVPKPLDVDVMQQAREP
jgi:hypothetical protein